MVCYAVDCVLTIGKIKTQNFYCLFTGPGFAACSFLSQPKIGMVARFAQFLFLLLPSLGQEISSTDVACDPGFLCKNERHCPRFLDLKDQLNHLLINNSETEHRDKLIRKLKDRICNKAERGVCCKQNLEVINGNAVNNVEDIPFIVRLQIKTSSWPYSYSIWVRFCRTGKIPVLFLFFFKSRGFV